MVDHNGEAHTLSSVRSFRKSNKCYKCCASVLMVSLVNSSPCIREYFLFRKQNILRLYGSRIKQRIHLKNEYTNQPINQSINLSIIQS